MSTDMNPNAGTKEKDGPLVEKPGLYYNLPARDYHADPCVEPSLSSTVARTLVGRSAFHAWLEHPRLGGKAGADKATKAMDTGSLVHALLSGNTDEFEVGAYDSFRSNAAKEWRAGVEAQGKLAVLEAHLEAALPAANAIRKAVGEGCSPDQNPFLQGRPEVSAVWRAEAGCWCRARLDNLILVDPYATIHDWKTTEDASPGRLERHVVDMGYHVQAAFYKMAVEALRPDFQGRVSFVFYFVEMPTLSVVPMVLSEGFMHLGARIVGRAIERFSHCLQTGVWPGYCPDGRAVELAPQDWYVRKMEGVLS
jgi:hypothetical protein